MSWRGPDEAPEGAMAEAFAVYDPATGRALAVFVSPAHAGRFLRDVQASVDHRGALRADPWIVPAEIFEAD